MLSETIVCYGIMRPLREAGYFETAHHRQILRELDTAIRRGGLTTLCGIVGWGKTRLGVKGADRRVKSSLRCFPGEPHRSLPPMGMPPSIRTAVAENRSGEMALQPPKRSARGGPAKAGSGSKDRYPIVRCRVHRTDTKSRYPMCSSPPASSKPV